MLMYLVTHTAGLTYIYLQLVGGEALSLYTYIHVDRTTYGHGRSSSFTVESSQQDYIQWLIKHLRTV